MSWEAAKAIMGDERVLLGPQASYQWLHDPKHLLFVLARYKHAARLIGNAGTVLEVGCGEGIGSTLLADDSLYGGTRRYLGIDPDRAAIAVAEDCAPSLDFLHTDLAALGEHEIDPLLDPFDAVVAIDVIEHIPADETPGFLSAIAAHLQEDGVCVIGTPNATAAAYQSPASRAAHHTLCTADDLREVLALRFTVVQLFGMNDEVLHTGFLPMAHYLLGVGIGPR